MIYEINLWLNPGQIYNGTVNVNRGERVNKFSRLVPLNRFIEQGIANGQFEPESAGTLSGVDAEALYAWLGDSANFVTWNRRQPYAEISSEDGVIKVPLNKAYTQVRKGMPTISFRVEV